MTIGKGYISSPLKFYVKEKVTGQRVDYNDEIFFLDCYWLQKVEGEKKGLEFLVPIEHPEYGLDIEDSLASLCNGDKITMKLKSMNDRGTKWIGEEIIEIETN